MGIFTDDFQRANGALGGNWVTIYGSPLITGGNVYGTTGWSTIDTTLSESGRMEATVHVFRAESTTIRSGVIVKADGASAVGFWAGVDGAAVPYRFAIRSGGSHTGGILASVELAGIPGPFLTIKLAWEDGNLQAWLNGALLIEYFDVLYASNTYAGIAGGGAAAGVADFRLITGGAVAFDVSPNVVGNFGDPVELALTGTGTAWTPGTPGSPTFTTSRGTITAQVVADATHATLTVDFGNYLGPVTFTDPSTGETDTIMVTSDPAYLPGITGQLSVDAVAYIERSAIAEASPTIANREMLIQESGPSVTLVSGVNAIRLGTIDKTYAPGGVDATNALLYRLWKVLNNWNEQGTYAWTPTRDTSLKEDLEYLVNEFYFLRGVGDLTLEDVLDSLKGIGDYSHTALMDAITALQPTDLQPVLDAIAAARGNPVANLRQIVIHLDALRTINDWTLGNVKAWIEAIPGGSVDLQPVLDAIAALSSQLTSSTTNIRNDIAALGLVVVAVETLLGTVDVAVSGVAGVVADVLEIVQGLENRPSPALWPGLANATLGTEVALIDQLELTTPMHGILVNVTTPPTRTGRREIGGRLMDYGVGEISFLTDNGYAEPWQYMGFRQAIYTPRTMGRASGAIFRVLAGAAGNVRPWTRT